MWNDFFVFGDEPVLGFNASRLAFNHGKVLGQFPDEVASSGEAKLRAVFRAHQHSSVPNPAMNRIIASKGAFRHWQATDSIANEGADKSALRSLVEQTPQRPIPEGSVWTFNVAPDSVYGDGNDYSFDTIGILSTADKFPTGDCRSSTFPVSVQ